MPITEELQNVKELESVGFPHEQAEALADVIEKSHRDSQESLKDFIRDQFKGLDVKFKDIEVIIKDMEVKFKDMEVKFKDMEVKFKDMEVKFKGLEVSMAVSQKDMLMKIFAIIVGTVGVAVTILKLF
ncbi:MAG: hypothetical protein ACUZ8H_08820 [Candidatus Anammoxibacter sp.]